MSCLRKSAILLLLIAGVFSCFASGPQRIAVVDLERVFREYYKSRIAEEMIRKQAKAYRDYLIRLNSELKQLAAEAQTARSNALNIALDPAEKQKVERDAAAKSEAFRAKEAEIKLFVNERSGDMRKLETEKRTAIMNEIRAEIRKRAAAEGYDFVFDRSGKTTNDQPAILLYPEKNDITNAVIRELNRSRNTPVKK